MDNKIGEVIESTTTSFLAEAYELYNLPVFGSLVKIVDPVMEVYGVVCQATTTGIEPGRQPIARGRDEASEEAIYQSNPQLTKLLRSEFSVMVVGYNHNDSIYQYLPPRPARIHAFVYLCSADEVKRFSQSFDFLNLLISSNSPVPVEELIASVLREISRVQDDSQAFLVIAGKTLAKLLAGDYRRLRAILGRLQV